MTRLHLFDTVKKKKKKISFSIDKKDSSHFPNSELHVISVVMQCYYFVNDVLLQVCEIWEERKTSREGTDAYTDKYLKWTR